MGEPWFGIYLPQLRMSFDRILERTLAAEAAGFDSVWLMDHFTAPAAPEVDTFEGLTVATALAARTSTIRIGHLVLCDPFRHPVLLAKMAATLDVISGGRLELGIGWGSVPAELETYGFGPEPPAVRAAKLRETLEILELMFAGETFDYDGAHYRLRRAIGRPVPRAGAGAGAHRRRRTEAHDAARGAVRRLVELPGIRARPHRRAPTAGRCGARSRRSTRSGSRPTPATRDEVIATAHRRFGTWGGVIAGTADEVGDALAAEVDRGVEGFVLQFSDFGTPETIQRFMTDVAPAVRAATAGRGTHMDTPMAAETVTITGHDGDEIEAYFARPTSPGPYPGVVVIHHMPGYDRSTKEIVRTFAVYGYAALCPNLFHRYAPGARADRRGHGRERSGWRPRRAVHRRRARRGRLPARAPVVERPRRRDRLLLRRSPGVRGRVQSRPRRRGRLLRRARRRRARRSHARASGRARSISRPTSRARLLGLFGAEDTNPSPEQTAQIEAALDEHGKTYEFHTFENAGHAFFSVDRPNYNLDASKRRLEADLGLLRPPPAGLDPGADPEARKRREAARAIEGRRSQPSISRPAAPGSVGGAARPAGSRGPARP